MRFLRTNLHSYYRYGFQAQEKDDEIKGSGNSLNYKYRMHDPRIGRFFAIDPMYREYPFYSPYAFCGNRVIDCFEMEGLQPNDADNTGVGAPASLNSLDGGGRSVDMTVTRQEASDIMTDPVNPGLVINDDGKNQRVFYNPNYDKGGIRGTTDVDPVTGAVGGQKGGSGLETAATVSVTQGQRLTLGVGVNVPAGAPADAAGANTMHGQINSVIANVNAQGAALASAVPAPGMVSPTGTTGGAVPTIANSQSTLIRLVLNNNDFTRGVASQAFRNATTVKANLEAVYGNNVTVQIVDQNRVSWPGVRLLPGDFAADIYTDWHEF